MKMSCFLVVKGQFRIEFRDKTVWLQEGEFIIVPHGVEHRPVADEECWILLFEPASTLNTGNVENNMTCTSSSGSDQATRLVCVALGVDGSHRHAEADVGQKHAEDGHCDRVGFGKERFAQKQGNPGYSESRKEQSDNRPDRDQKRTFHGALPELLRCSLN